MVIFLAYLLPRVALYQGIDTTSNFTFADMIYHQYHLDLMAKQVTLSAEQQNDPYFLGHPLVRERIQPYRWPPAVYYAALPWATLFGPLSLWTVQLTNFFYTVVLLVGLVGLGAELHSLRLGLWGALLFVLLPAHMASTWYLSLDFPLAAMCIMGLYLLVRTRDLSLTVPSLMLGLWSGLGLFTKLSYVIYLLVPSLWLLVRGLVKGPRLRVLCNAAAGAGLSLGFIAVFLRPNWEEIWGELEVHALSTNLPAALIPVGSLDWVLSQPIFAALNYPFPLLALVLPGLLALHVGRRFPAHRVTLLLYFWGSLVLLTVMTNKLERYLHPVYPLLCLLAALWVVRWLRGKLQTLALAGAALAFAAVLAVTQVHPTPWLTGDDNRRPNARMWSEYAMPGLARLDELRRRPTFNQCELGQMVARTAAWAERDPRRRPLGLAHVRIPGRPGNEVPFGEYLLLVAQRLQDRYVLAGGLFAMDRIPGDVADTPLSVVVHARGEDPFHATPPVEARVREQATVRLSCVKSEQQNRPEAPAPFTLTLASPLNPPPPPPPPEDEGDGE